MTTHNQLISFIFILICFLSACQQNDDEPITTTTPASLSETLIHKTVPAPNHAQTTPGPIVPPQTSTPAPTSTPTNTPMPATRVVLGATAIAIEDFAGAIDHLNTALRSATELDTTQYWEAQFELALAQFAQSDYNTTIAILTNYLNTPDNAAPDPRAHFYLGQAHLALGDCPTAILAYEQYLARNTTAAAYIYPLIGQCHLWLNDTTAAITAYTAATQFPAQRVTRVETLYKLANLHLSLGNYPAAIAQYQAIYEAARTPTTRSDALYQIGQIAELNQQPAVAIANYQQAVNNYPTGQGSYLSLIELINQQQPVDEYQRGLIDYHAQAYLPCIDAFQNVISTTTNIQPDTYRYLAWCYEGVGEWPQGIEQLNNYANTQPDDIDHLAQATAYQAEMLVRQQQITAAAQTYQTFINTYPNHSRAPEFAFKYAQLWTRLGRPDDTLAAYQTMANRYPNAPDAPEAYYRAGITAYELGRTTIARTLWTSATIAQPTSEYSAASLIWLIQTSPDEETATPHRRLAARLPGATFYAVRARDLGQQISPFTRNQAINLTMNAAEQAEAEAWLRQWLELDPTANIAPLAPHLRDDPRRRVGTTLWQLGLLNEAKRELEDLRQDYADDPLASYQLALYFRELGLYRSSILAASRIYVLANVNIFTAPTFIGKLTYPPYYADNVQALARQYQYDPLIQMALIRQESLFESFATSHAAAKGLSQVIPGTGIYIANKLNWPNYTEADLYRPYTGLAFGAYYLHEQLINFDGEVHMALAAYNGGPGNAYRWAQTAPDHIDGYITTVDFYETRQYIYRIYSGYAFYRYLYTQ
ncbi:MAG TPA: tetratricopeptide repeat protein [Anaerolineae bacterium]|nr:tetratricopeptide repeat protein [Anaerolineae bacterium]